MNLLATVEMLIVSANKVGIEMTRFFGSTLLWLKPMLPDVEAQAVSNILWSSAKLGLNPDAFVPGMTDALAAKLLQLTRVKPDANQIHRVCQLGVGSCHLGA